MADLINVVGAVSSDEEPQAVAHFDRHVALFVALPPLEVVLHRLSHLELAHSAHVANRLL